MTPEPTANPHSSLDAYDLRLSETPTAAGMLQRVLQVIQDAESLSLFKQAGDRPELGARQKISESQICTLHTRLGLLGYLDPAVPPEWEQTGVIKISPRMREAIRTFKEEAGLALHPKDNWVDPDTWQTLDELVSFEEPFDEGRWTGKTGDQRRALRRAAGARLAVLGFLDGPSYDKQKIEQGLAAFEQLIRLLAPGGLPPSDGARLGDEELQQMDRLFDQPALVRCLAGFEKAFAVPSLPYGLAPDEAARKVNCFAACAANIELWLLGYPVELKDNYAMQPETYFKQPVPVEESETAPFYVLRDFWRDSGQRKLVSLAKAGEGITGEFFKVVKRVIQDGEKLHLDQRQSERLYSQMAEKGPRARQDFLPMVWDKLKELGSRMWDGIKRAWTWLVRQFNHALAASLTKAANIARLAFHFAVEAFGQVKTAADQFIHSLRYVLPGTVAGSSYLQITNQLDYRLIIPNLGVDLAQAAALGKDMLQGAQHFGSGMQMLGKLLSLLVKTAQLILIPGAGWFIFIMALVKLIGQALA